jgi:hypothetical protein
VQIIILAGLTALALLGFCISAVNKTLFPSKTAALVATGALTALLAGVTGISIATSPQYSVYQMYNAAQNRDYENFSRYFDTDSVVGNIFSDASKKQADSSFGAAFAQALLPGLKQSVKDSIKHSVEKGEFDKKNASFSLIAVFQRAKVTMHGNTSDIKLADSTMTARKHGTHWQVFALSSTSVSQEASASPSPSPSVKQVKYGSRNDITNGWFQTAGAPAPYASTDEFDKPSSGNTYIAVELTYENASKERGSYSLSNLKLRDSANHEYEYKYRGKEPKLPGDDLEAGGKVTGFVTFEVPQGADITQVKYSGDDITLIYQ